MLALTRRPGEEIVIIDRETGEEIIVAVPSDQKHVVRIGIEASERFDIVREELLEDEPADPVN